MRIHTSRGAVVLSVIILVTTATGGQAFAEKHGPVALTHGHHMRIAALETSAPHRSRATSSGRITVVRPTISFQPARPVSGPQPATTAAPHFPQLTLASHTAPVASPWVPVSGIRAATTTKAGNTSVPITPITLASIAPSVAITSSVQSPTPVSVPPIQIQLAKGTTGSQSSDTANAALGIGIAALVVALLALGVGALALRRRASVGATAAHPSDDETGGWVSLGQAARALDMPSETVLQRIQAGQLEATYATSGRRKGLRVNLNGTNDIAARPSAPQTAQAGSTGPRDRAAGSSSGWLSLDQAAQAFGIPPAAVLRQVQTGQLDATYHTRGRQKGLRIKVASGGGPLPNPPSRPAAAPVNAAAAPTEKPSYGWLSLDEAARALAVPREVILSRIQAGTLEAIHANKGPHKGLRVKVEPFTNPRPGAGGS